MTVKYVRDRSATSVTAYDVYAEGERIGRAERRRGGWWRAYVLDGDKWRYAGAWHTTRKECAAAIERSREPVASEVIARGIRDHMTP